MTDAIRTAIEGASAYLTDHPDEARYTDSVATARVEEGLRIRVEGHGGETLTTDMPGRSALDAHRRAVDGGVVRSARGNRALGRRACPVSDAVR